MAFDARKNFAITHVATAPSPATSGTSLVVTTGEGALLPTPPYNATIWPSGVQATSANSEIVRVTAASTDTLTIVRTQESTSARTIVAGDQFMAGLTNKTLADIETALSGGGSNLVAGGALTTGSSVLISGLDLGTDKGYIIDFSISFYNGANADAIQFLFNDTSAYAGLNWSTLELTSAGTITADNQTSKGILQLTTGYHSQLAGYIRIGSGVTGGMNQKTLDGKFSSYTSNFLLTGYENVGINLTSLRIQSLYSDAFKDGYYSVRKVLV